MHAFDSFARAGLFLGHRPVNCDLTCSFINDDVVRVGIDIRRIKALAFVFFENRTANDGHVRAQPVVEILLSTNGVNPQATPLAPMALAPITSPALRLADGL